MTLVWLTLLASMITSFWGYFLGLVCLFIGLLCCGEEVHSLGILLLITGVVLVMMNVAM